MAELRTALVLGASILALSASAASAAPASSLVPLPASQEIIDQASPVAIAEGARIETPAGDADARAAADYLRDLTERTRGLGLRVASAGASPAVVFRRDPTVAGGPEAYDLRVEKGRVTISAAGGWGCSTARSPPGS